MAEPAPNPYARSGVDYGSLDALKRFAQSQATETGANLPLGVSVVEASRGESAFVMDIGPYYLAMVPEGLGTKNLVADAMNSLGQSTYYRGIAKDTVAMIVNDLLTVGGRPIAINAHWSFGSSEFLRKHPQKGLDIASGWAEACREAGAAYGAGETPTLVGIVYPEVVELSGSGIGIIEPKSRLTLGDRLKSGDHIVLIESSGIHANGLTLAREVAGILPQGYNTMLPSGRKYGEALLTPTHIYAFLQQQLFNSGIDIHYIVNMTGHGWRKLMRATPDFTYRMHTVPPPQEEFALIQEVKDLNNTHMYETFNMGAGFAFIVPPADAGRVTEQANTLGFKNWDAGVVEEGIKQVIVEPKDITYNAESLNIR